MFPKLQEKLRSDLRAVQQTYRDLSWMLDFGMMFFGANSEPAIRSTEQKHSRNSIEIKRSGIPIQQWMFSNNREIPIN
jgi:hypothetical protein